MAPFSAVLEMWLNLRLRSRGLTWWDTSTLCSFCAQHFEWTLSRLLEYPWFTDTLAPLTWPPCSPVLITMDRSLWGSITESVAAFRYTTNAELWKMPLTPLRHKFYDACHRRHGGISACVSSIRVRMQIC
jgi:hypothetical protein